MEEWKEKDVSQRDALHSDVPSNSIPIGTNYAIVFINFALSL